MRVSRLRLSICLVAALSTLVIGFSTVQAADGGKISIQELKSRLGDRNLLIIDVRDEIGWSKSNSKIQGAAREDPSDVASWAGKYPRDAVIVLY